MKILITGAAGFIGSSIVKTLARKGHEIVGLDNINSYYDIDLKYARLESYGIEKEKIREGEFVESRDYKECRFIKLDIANGEALKKLFEKERFTHVINMAAQAGVRYSLDHPLEYIRSNILGFTNILEACHHYPVEHLVYASSSSVYGNDNRVPYRETDYTDHPVSIYAATKKSNELLAYAYAKLYKIPATGVRMFTVYGPWGRPDMAPWLFTSAILKGERFKVFNYGDMQRDFTYIDDVVEGIIRMIPSPPNNIEISHQESESLYDTTLSVDSVNVPHAVYNIGCSSPVELMDFIRIIEEVTGKKAIIEMTGMQPGDVVATYADTTLLEFHFGYKPSTPLKVGIAEFYKWFKNYANL